MKVPRPPVTPMERVSGIPADPPDNPTHTLDPRVQRQLRRHQLYPSASRGGFTRIPSLAYTNADHGYDALDIPTEWNSPQHLQFCGLRLDAAEHFHALWKSGNVGEEDGWLTGSAADDCLVDVALGAMRTSRYDDVYATGDWEGALAELGLAQDAVDAIMDPRYERIRERGDPFHWARDTIATNHNFLLELNRRIHARKDHLSAVRSIREDGRAPEKMCPEPEDTEDAKIYYMPLPAHSIGKVFDVLNAAHPGFVSSASELHPTAQHYIHLLKDRSLATDIASYAASRCRAKEAVVLHVPVPTALVEQAREEAMSWEEWRRLVWFSRNPKAREVSGDKLPASLRRYAERTVLEVPLCGLSEERIAELASEQDIKVMRLEGGVGAYQFVFQGQEARRLWYTYATHEIHPEWVTDVASRLSPSFISREDITDKEWGANRMDCWNGWRWNERPPMSWL